MNQLERLNDRKRALLIKVALIRKQIAEYENRARLRKALIRDRFKSAGPEPKQWTLDTPLCDLRFTRRAQHMFECAKLITLGDLLQRSETELFHYRNFGRLGVFEVADRLRRKGFRLRVD